MSKFTLSFLTRRFIGKWLDKKLSEKIETIDDFTVKLLLFFGANPHIDAVIGTCFPIIARSARGGFSNHLRNLLEYGGDPNLLSNDQKWTPLHMAASKGHEGCIDVLLKYGADLNAKTIHGWTPLICAIREDKEEAVAALLLAGANPDDRDDKGRTVLEKAVSANNYGIVLRLLNAGADIHLKRAGKYEWGVLHLAACHGDLRMIKLLIANGADPLEVGPFNRTPAVCARGEGKAEAMAYLESIELGLQAKADESAVKKRRRI